MNTKETRATIERVRRLSAHLQRIDIGVEQSLTRIKPGQALLAHMADTWEPYLAEQWTPVATKGRTVTIERPTHTQYTPGQVVTLVGPVGAPFTMRYNLRSLLLLALDTAPTPLVLLASMAIKSKIEVTLVLGGSARDYPLDALPAELEILEGDLEEGWPNQVTTVGWADQIIATANPTYRDQTYKALVQRINELRADVPTRFMLGLYDLPMPCGVGACQGCGVSCSDGDKLICVDGPAIDLATANFA